MTIKFKNKIVMENFLTFPPKIVAKTDISESICSLYL